MGHTLKVHRHSLLLLLAFLLMSGLAFGQYTEVINSNRPGLAISAYAVGKSVVQAEFGLFYEQRNHSDLSWDSNIFGSDLALRYGLLLESLEIKWEGRYQRQDIDYLALGFSESRSALAINRLGIKYLLFDPYKNPERNKPNLYSWRANNKFQWKNLIPAVSLYGGANFTLGDNPFYIEDPTISPRALLATQSQLTPRSVLVINLIYDKIGTDFPEWTYLISYSRAFRNPKWSAFIENQGTDGDRYSDILLRTGVSHLLSPDFQLDLGIGGNFKSSPSRYFGTLGLSYRLDYHQDQPISARNGKGDRPISKNSMKKKNSGQFALSKKEMRKQKKTAKKRKKEAEKLEF